MEPVAESKPKSPWPTLVALAVLFAAVAWLVLVGRHRHRLEFTVNGKAVHIASRRATWLVQVPGQPDRWEFRLGHCFANRGSSRLGDKVVDGLPVAEAFQGWGVMETIQRNDLTAGEVRLTFAVNGKEFVLTATELRYGDRAWPLANVPTEVDVDALP